MMDEFDPDQICGLNPEMRKLDRLLAALQDCDLGAWDQDFVDDMTKRLDKQKNALTVTGGQWEQLERMRRQYGVKER